MIPILYSGRRDPLAELTAGPSGLGRSDVGDCRRAASHWTRPGGCVCFGGLTWVSLRLGELPLVCSCLLLAVDPTDLRLTQRIGGFR